MSVLFRRSNFLGIALLLTFWIAPRDVHAEIVAYLSATGTATGAACRTPSTPCGNILAALSSAGDGGTVICLTPGQFGNVGSSLGYTLICPGGTFQFLGLEGAGKNYRIVGAILRNSDATSSAISIDNAANVTLENVTIVGNASSAAIRNVSAGPTKISLTNSVIADSAGIGILIAPTSGIIAIAIDNVKVTNNTYGLALGAGARAMIDRSMFSENSIAGVEADAGAFIGLNNSLVSNNATGVVAGGTIAISNSGINSNNTGISGATQSYGNNRFFANISDGTAPTPVGQR